MDEILTVATCKGSVIGRRAIAMDFESPYRGQIGTVAEIDRRFDQPAYGIRFLDGEVHHFDRNGLVVLN